MGRKKGYVAKYKNKDGSQRAQHLLLPDAMKNTVDQTGWSPARKKAFKNIEKNPSDYYYRFNKPGEQSRLGKWNDAENKLLMKRATTIGVNSDWGEFSKAIPGRVGYQCSGRWSALVRRGKVKDWNYFCRVDSNNKKKWNFKWKNTVKIEKCHDLVRCKKYGFEIVDNASNLPKKHPKCPSTVYFKSIEEKYKEHFAKKYVKYLQQSSNKKRIRKEMDNDNNDKEEPNTKRRKRSK